MSQQPLSNAPGDEYFSPGPYLPPGHGGLGAPQRPPMSKIAVWGFVIACVSLFVFGFIGLVGMFLGGRGLRAIRTGRARGRGLAIAGIAIGAASFIFYLVAMFIRNN